MSITTNTSLNEDDLLDIVKTTNINDKMAIYWNNPEIFFFYK